MKVIHYLVATLVLSALAVDIGFAEHSGRDGKRAPGTTARIMSSMASGHALHQHQDRIGGAATNAVGLAVGNGGTVGRIDAGHTRLDAVDPGAGTAHAVPGAGTAHAVPGAGSAAIVHSVPPPIGTAHGAAGINGTGVVRPGSGPAAIGGAGIKSASINGTTIRAKHY